MKSSITKPWPTKFSTYTALAMPGPVSVWNVFELLWKSIRKPPLSKAEPSMMSISAVYVPLIMFVIVIKFAVAPEKVTVILSKHFVDVKIDIDRTLRGNEMKDRMTKGESPGIPWYAFLGPKGEIVVDSTLPERGNIGYPYTNKEIATFMKVVQKAAQRMSDDDMKQLTKSLRNRGEQAKEEK